MTISSQFQSQFDSKIRSRGQRYYHLGRVNVTVDDNETVEAYVEGDSDDYSVQIIWNGEEDQADVYCSCPHFSDGHMCKHLWATLLELDDLATTAIPSENPFLRSPARTRNRSKKAGAKSAPPPAWMRQLDQVEREFSHQSTGHEPTWVAKLDGATRQIWYVIDVTDSNLRSGTVIKFLQRETRADGKPGRIKPFLAEQQTLKRIADPIDQQLLSELLERRQRNEYDWRYNGYNAYQKVSESQLPTSALGELLPRLCETGRLVWRLGDQQPPDECAPLTWDDGPPWRLQMDVSEESASRDWTLTGTLTREALSEKDRESIGERPLSEAVLVDKGGVVLFEDHLARLDSSGETFPWLAVLRKEGAIRIPATDQDAFVARLGRTPGLTAIRLPHRKAVADVEVECRPHLRMIANKDVESYRRNHNQMYARIDFLYGDVAFPVDMRELARIDPKSKQLIRRQPQREAEFLSQLGAARIKPATYVEYRRDDAHVQFLRNQFVDVVRTLTGQGWIVEADGRSIRQPGSVSMSVTSNIDWFDLEAQFDFGGAVASLPALLEAVRKGEQFVRLDDGSQGMLPEDWLKKYGDLAALGESADGTLRFRPSQAMLLDALLEAQPKADVDRSFRAFTNRLRKFEGIKSKAAPRAFRGTLRDYQQEGLSWLQFLQEYRLGGCLADDMGLGKTVQVLALLQSRRSRRLKQDEQRLPSLVIVPKSLVFNWIEEATRFTPNLKVMNYTGPGRKQMREQFDEQDVIVTTYGTLRRDVARLQKKRFDYAILDESQAIKNEKSASAKACRLIPADHRLAMTGTPVENHLGELWSLFEFLNPGMLGRSTAFKNLTRNSNDPDDDSLNMLATSLRPYLLRRTKEQVLTELPEKSEQTLFCEMPRKQRKLYDELRDYYRASLTQRIADNGLQKSKIHVLEALLRLRQAACHPGLIDKGRSDEPSAKLETLLEQLESIVDEGHKVLVFSQFTSLLKIVRQRLDDKPVTYEYLDGRTRKRQQKVERFQNDPDCPLFLISLKAGGHGLNLTAADYVYILDPWWNPAVEAQAVDRAHRIGQERRVFAYRLICRDSVEERILDLQQKKRKLADAIISADTSLVRNLSAEDLQLLLS